MLQLGVLGVVETRAWPIRLRSPDGRSSTVKAGAVTAVCAMSPVSQNRLTISAVLGELLDEFWNAETGRGAVFSQRLIIGRI